MNRRFPLYIAMGLIAVVGGFFAYVLGDSACSYICDPSEETFWGAVQVAGFAIFFGGPVCLFIVYHREKVRSSKPPLLCTAIGLATMGGGIILWVTGEFLESLGLDFLLWLVVLAIPGGGIASLIGLFLLVVFLCQRRLQH